MTTELLLERLRRLLTLDPTLFPEVRDDRSFTTAAAALAAAAVLMGGLGAFLYGETVLDFSPDNWFVETVLLGSIFTFVLLAASISVVYLALSQLYGLNVTLDGLGRVLALCYTLYAVSFFVFLPEIGFTFGLLSVAAMFYYSVAGVRGAVPEATPVSALVAIGAGFAVWITIMTLVAEPGDNFFNGPFVYSIGD